MKLANERTGESDRQWCRTGPRPGRLRDVRKLGNEAAAGLRGIRLRIPHLRQPIPVRRVLGLRTRVPVAEGPDAGHRSYLSEELHGSRHGNGVPRLRSVQVAEAQRTRPGMEPKSDRESTARIQGAGHRRGIRWEPDLPGETCAFSTPTLRQ